jgi:CelD/BcsL family acetyltransferase involved in cellulose biosynthesis
MPEFDLAMRPSARSAVVPPAWDAGPQRLDRALQGHIDLEVCSDLGAIEREWKSFAAKADATAFQAIEWLAKWQQHIGVTRGTIPAIVLGRNSERQLRFILPLAVEPRGLVRHLTWLASDLCDYNAPLLARGFSQALGTGRFVGLWQDVVALLRRDAGLRFDVIDLPKMPEAIGGQKNPFLDLQTVANPSGAYAAILDRDWGQFYAAKRSSATRKKERQQGKHLAKHGEVRFVDVQESTDIERTLDILIGQKERSFARLGVDNIFARPGYRTFFREIATDPATRELVHVSRLEVGSVVAAANLGLRSQACYYLVLSSYDDGELSRFGPGRAHLHELLRYAIDCGFQKFDFTIGDEPYKRDWSDIELKLYDHLAAVTLRGWLVVGITAALRRTKRFIKQTPAMWRAFTRARALAGSIGPR